MQTYEVRKHIQQCSKENSKENSKEKELDVSGCRIRIMNREEFLEESTGLPHRHTLVRYMENLQYCRAELYGNCILGTFLIPERKNPWEKRYGFAFYMTEQELILIDDGEFAKAHVDRMRELVFDESENVASVLVCLMESLIREDSIFLQQYEKQLTEIETLLLDGVPENFYATILQLRKEVMVLHGYYVQLENMSDLIETNTNKMLTENECQGFHYFADRCGRLHDQTENLREYILQIREMYQSRLDLEQNRAMNALTVITAIFMPLTLIAGWYGMNFTQMPELAWQYGYPLVIIISVLIVVADIHYFKKKKLL